MIVIGVGLSFCLLGYLTLILIAAVHFKRIPENGGQDQNPSITVVIPARNEARGICLCLDAMARQEYPSVLWEVIVVDDHSTDATAALVLEWIQKHPLVRIRLIRAEGAGKKQAIETGALAATGEWILQTDADCQSGPFWIRAMATFMTRDRHFVSGPVRLKSGKSKLENLQALEMAGLVTLGAGSMAAGIPNMANGANMAFRKSTFQNLGGYRSSGQVASGDDEFLLQAIHQAYPQGLAFAKSQEAIVDTPTQPDWQSLRRQRIRWVSKARSYINRGTNVIQMISWLGFLAFPWWAIAGFFYNPGWYWLVGLFGLKVAIDHWLMKQGTVFLQRPDWMRWFILLELVYIPYVIWIGIRGNLTSTYIWKDREVT